MEYSPIAPLSNKIDALITTRETEGLSKYGRALAALTGGEAYSDDWADLEGSLKGIIEQCGERSPQSMAECAAWIIGLLLYKWYSAAHGNEHQRDISADLLQVYRTLSLEAETWFAFYLFEGFQGAGNERETFLESWRLQEG
jgi:hypothetical protein